MEDLMTDSAPEYDEIPSIVNTYNPEDRPAIPPPLPLPLRNTPPSEDDPVEIEFEFPDRNQMILITENRFGNLRFVFFIVAVFNVIILIGYIILQTPIKNLIIHTPGQTDIDEEQYFASDTFKLCTKCNRIEHLLKPQQQDILIMKMDAFPDHCCFREINELLKFYDAFVEEALNPLKYNTMELSKTTKMLADLMHASNHFVLNQTNYTNSGMEDLQWVDKKNQKGIDLLGGDRIRISERGFYFVYINTRSGVSSDHWINYTVDLYLDSGKQTHKKLASTDVQLRKIGSQLQGVFYFEKDDKLFVRTVASHLHMDANNLNYFGVFMI